VATGYLPPEPDQLIQGVYPASFFPVKDPQRGNTRVGSTTPVTLEGAGSPTLQPERARTVSIGFVATPAWASGLLRIPIEAGHGFRREAGQGSELKPARVPI